MLKISFTLLFSILISISAFGGVNKKNGNFFISYTDLIVGGNKHNIPITRDYNSISTHNGWFGLGWGSIFETKLLNKKDGSIVIIEYGSGATNLFTLSKNKTYRSLSHNESIIKSKSGYERKSNNKTDFFDSKGRLLKTDFTDGYSISLTYKNDKMVLIKDSESNVVHFDWLDSGRVKKKSIAEIKSPIMNIMQFIL